MSNHPKIAIPEYLLNEKIERAARAFQELPSRVITKLFLVIPVSYSDGEGEIDLETKYGKLKTFFCKELAEFQQYGQEKPKTLLLSHHRFPYPKISKVKSVKSLDSEIERETKGKEMLGRIH